jgi:deazaflavin-dependent oxidoreductase (nitroreductase family)
MSNALPERLAREPYCYLETTGRVTGRPHEIEIWFASEGGTLYLLSGGGDRADWVRNLRKEPRVRVRIRDVTFAGTARPIEGAEDDPLARRLLAAKYQGWREGQPLSQWARTALPVAVRLEQPSPRGQGTR